MATIQQLTFKHKTRKKKKKKSRSPALRKNPFKRAYCLRVFITTPRKPNSAKRKVARIIIIRFRKRITIGIPGTDHKLQKYSKVWVRGGNPVDIPGVRYKAVRGKLDLGPWYGRAKARSKYGVKRPLSDLL